MEEQQKLWHDEINRLDPRYGMHSSRRDNEHANSLSSSKDAYQPTGAPINRPERSWFQISQNLITLKRYFFVYGITHGQELYSSAFVYNQSSDFERLKRETEKFVLFYLVV